MKTNDFFKPHKLSIIMDAGAGSSGKGKIGSFICENADNWQFACNTFYPQAGHWVRLDDGREFFYQTLNSCAYLNRYEKLYVGAGSIMELPAFFRELEENNVRGNKIGIDPMVAILQDKDAAFERGEVDLDGNPSIKNHGGTMKHGSTCHGVGAARTRRVLRRHDALLAKDVPELRPFLCDVSEEIMNRLDHGQAGLLEIAQGFQLSNLLDEFYPHTTSRNCTVAAGLDDMMIPPIYAGNVLLNFRTFPIRISNYKYISEDGKHLTWAEVQEYNATGRKYSRYEGNSGHGYDDQIELTWDQITKDSGSPTPIIEMTSVTKLPRRVFTFSGKNLQHALRHNRPSEDSRIDISVNFVNYIDHSVAGARDSIQLTSKVRNWLDQNIKNHINNNVRLRYLGTGAKTDDTIVL